MNRTGTYFVAGFVVAAMAFAMMAGAPFVRTGGDPQIEGNVTFYGDTTLNGSIDATFGATELLDIDAATTTSTGANGALHINWKGSTAGSQAVFVEAEAGADVAEFGVNASLTSVASGSSDDLYVFRATPIGNASDSGAAFVSYYANAFAANGGTSTAVAFGVNSSYDVALAADSGDIVFTDYAPIIYTERDAAGNGDNLTIHAGDGSAAAAEAQNGGDLLLYGGLKANAGTDGDTLLAWTGAAAQGNVGVGRDAAAERLEVAGNILSTGDLIVDGGNVGITGDLDLLGLVATDLTVNGDTSLTNAGGDSNSYKLKLEAHLTSGDETQTSSLYTAFGADPYLVIAAPSATGVETQILHIDTASLRFSTDDSVDIGATGANRPQDIYLAGNLDAEAGSITAQTGITSDTGSITATAGAVVAGTSVSDQYADVRMTQPTVEAADPGEPFDCVSAVRGWHILVDDTDDGANEVECVCLRIDDVPNYEWQRADDNSTVCPSLP